MSLNFLLYRNLTSHKFANNYLLEFETVQMGRLSAFCSFQTGSGTIQHPVKWLRFIKLQGLETNYKPPSRIEVKKSGTISPFPLHLHDDVLN
jgi:hypothetical protein